MTKTIELNEQQVDFINGLIKYMEGASNTENAIAQQIINKLEE